MRFFDLLIALIGTLALAPLFIIIAVLIKLDTKGPVIYTQERVGLNGKLFRLYKFRSMVANADRIGTSVTVNNDPRKTRAGSILRKTKLDELPQLWNVLKGDMRLIGPRPDVPEIVGNYTPEMRHMLDVKPGITGNATLHLHDEEGLLALANDPDRAYEEIFVPVKAKLNLEHSQRKSFWFDISILAKTIWRITLGKIWPAEEHSVISEIKGQIIKQNEADGTNKPA